MKSFREQFDIIVGAYLRDELLPMDCHACFVGNMLDNSETWGRLRDGIGFLNVRNHFNEYAFKWLEDRFPQYTPEELIELEMVFLGYPFDNSSIRFSCESVRPADYEDRLFHAMERGLLLLRQIHESKGEVVEDYSFSQRELVV